MPLQAQKQNMPLERPYCIYSSFLISFLKTLNLSNRLTKFDMFNALEDLTCMYLDN